MMRDTPIHIPENHRRAIGATLALLDNALSRFELWGHGHEARSVLHSEENRLDARQRKMLLESIRAMRRDLKKLRDELRLERRVQDVSVAIWAEGAVLREALIELGSRYLRRYGDLPEGCARYLDREVAKLIGHLERVFDSLRMK
jgi:hypothetical protein